ncbi:MAG: ribose-phosphate diphosphokinase [Phenylobacterium sp.]|jgi:ribose-phosphate pyrophosphokinase|uniref:ribose-phosphate diphosphokinase n=1 Tax=Phenylobacterium sp. TaxID=1871053 RepID=UPI002A2F0DE3|nr:ribose-phosphate diphosphokinase [Phenylobacterium sp.]MDD3836581.1 ribose-phosphate diphosphokinase [Phenylobacterium sp.]MDX9999545.1 ribose-phosphate diphosphokinase [Phenylobacterium sp.]
MSDRPGLWSPEYGAAPPALAGDVQLFALDATAALGAAVATALGRPLAAHEERGFEDGEHKARPLQSVGGADCYVIQSLHGGPDQSANDKLCRLLFFVGALKDAGAARVTAVAPYLCYARKDRRTKPFDPVTTRYVGALFEAVGTDVLVSLEVHNPAAFENAFRGRSVTLSAAPPFVSYALHHDEGPLCVLSPDPGGAKRAELFREALEGRIGRPVGKAFADKHRSAGVVTGDLLVGDVGDATVLLVDDLISTGGTIVRAARAARAAGARRVIALAAHGLFMPGAGEALADPAVARIVVTDTVPPFRLAGSPLLGKLDVLPSAPLLAEAIGRLAAGRALTDLLVF